VLGKSFGRFFFYSPAILKWLSQHLHADKTSIHSHHTREPKHVGWSFQRTRTEILGTICRESKCWLHCLSVFFTKYSKVLRKCSCKLQYLLLVIIINVYIWIGIEICNDLHNLKVWVWTTHTSTWWHKTMII
jgi:hypothetical protein